MRRLGTLGDAAAAERFAAALRGRGVATDLRPEPDGAVAVWILDEDRLPDARAELAAFEADPDAQRFRVAKPPEDRSPSEKPMPVARRAGPVGPPDWKRLPVTVSLIAASVAATLWVWGDAWLGRGEAFARLAISAYVVTDEVPFAAHLPEVRDGHLWRLVTPILPHADPIHFLGNIGLFWLLAGTIEMLRGSFRLLGLILLTAVASNSAEYWLDVGLTFDVQNGLRSQTGVEPDPRFLGMSGVVFGLFGFVWMRARLLPRDGFAMPRDLVVWMMIWLLVCTAGLVGPIANVAHGVGLLAGMAVGAAPRLWRR